MKPEIKYVQKDWRRIREITNFIEVDEKKLREDAKVILDSILDMHQSIKATKDNIKKFQDTYLRTKEIMDELNKVSKCWTLPEVDFKKPEKFPEILINDLDE